MVDNDKNKTKDIIGSYLQMNFEYIFFSGKFRKSITITITQ